MEGLDQKDKAEFAHIRGSYASYIYQLVLFRQIFSLPSSTPPFSLILSHLKVKCT